VYRDVTARKAIYHSRQTGEPSGVTAVSEPQAFRRDMGTPGFDRSNKTQKPRWNTRTLYCKVLSQWSSVLWLACPDQPHRWVSFHTVGLSPRASGLPATCYWYLLVLRSIISLAMKATRILAYYMYFILPWMMTSINQDADSPSSSNNPYTTPCHQKEVPFRSWVRQKPVPRKGHTKSRRGCLNCKRRRIKCSEKHPECHHCIKSGLRCEYPSNITSTAPRFPTPITGELASPRYVAGTFVSDMQAHNPLR
jgi:hypothetical protein